jgi:branched-subunit amino acid transport protein
MSDLWIIIVVGVGTYLTRASFIVALADRDLPVFLVRAMRNVAPAVLAALVASLLVGDRGVAGLAQPAEVVALSTAGLVAYRTKNVPVTLVTGMVVLWLMRWLLP